MGLERIGILRPVCAAGSIPQEGRACGTAPCAPADRDRTRYQRKAAIALQVQSFKTLPYIPLGSFVQLVAYRKNLTGVWPCPVQAYWNIGKS